MESAVWNKTSLQSQCEDHQSVQKLLALYGWGRSHPAGDHAHQNFVTVHYNVDPSEELQIDLN